MLSSHKEDYMHGADDGYMYGADDGYMYGVRNLAGRPAGLSAGPGEAAAIGVGGLLLTALAATQVLFVYGIARSHPDKLVRTTGYFMATLGALTVISGLAGTVVGTVVASNQRF